MPRGRIGSEQKEEIRKSAHDRAVVCTWTIMAVPVLLECRAVPTFDLSIGYELVRLETCCENDHIRGDKTISSDDSIWDDFDNSCIGETQFIVV